MLEQIPLGYYAIAGLLNFITSFALSIFVFSKNPKSRTNQTFSLWTFTVAGWSLCYFLWLTTEKSYLAEIYLRTLMLFVILIPSTFTHFILTLLKINVSKKMILGNYLISFFLGLTVYTQVFAKDIGPFLVFPYWLKPRFPFGIHSIHFFANVIYSHFLMFQVIKRQSGIFRNQVLYVFIGTAIGYTAGAINYLTWYKIPIPPFLNPFVSISVASVAYAIIRHRLMDIEVIIKKTLVFASIFAMALGVVAGITFITQELIAGGRFLGLVISTMIIILAVRPLERFLINVTDKYLFQKKYDPAELIRTFSKAVLTELDLNKIAKSTVENLVGALKLVSCAILIPNKEGNRFIIRESYGIQDKKISFGKDAHMISYLGKVDSAILKNGKKPLPDTVIKDMELITADACLAIMIHKQLIGILCLGKKKSDQDYTKEDMDTLLLLADALGVAITNALAFEDVRQKEKLAAIGMLAAGIKHDIGTPLNQMSTSVQAFLIEREEGDHEKMDADEFRSIAYDLLTRCQMTFNKVSKISSKFADFASPKRKSELELINVAESIEDALGTLDREMQARNISIKKDIQRNLPPIVADREYMQEIFFNIIKNAAQAIQEAHRSKDESIISITAKEEPEKNVFIEIRDTGIGIPEDGLDKVFEPYYSTKQERGGTGLGLAIVRELVQRNNGKISVKSELGKGTSFILEFQGENHERES